MRRSRITALILWIAHHNLNPTYEIVLGTAIILVACLKSWISSSIISHLQREQAKSVSKCWITWCASCVRQIRINSTRTSGWPFAMDFATSYLMLAVMLISKARKLGSFICLGWIFALQESSKWVQTKTSVFHRTKKTRALQLKLLWTFYSSCLWRCLWLVHSINYEQRSDRNLIIIFFSIEQSFAICNRRL